MPNYCKRGEPGRFSLEGDKAKSHPVNVRCTAAQHHAYLTAGGAKWLRAQLDAIVQQERESQEPTAHQPFPPRISVTDAKTGEPIQHVITISEY